MDVELSLVCPAHNEAANIEPLVREWEEVLQRVGCSFEIILVDDGSTDDTFDRIRQLATDRPYLRGIRLASKSGQSAALVAGFQVARGRWIVTSDADLQNDPHDLPRLLRAAAEAELVCGWRRDLQDGVHDTGCGLKLIRRDLALRLLPFDGMHRFMPALARIEGYRVTEVVVNHRPRQRERSKYTFFNRLIKPIQDLRAIAWYRRRRVRYEIADQIGVQPVLPLRKAA